MADMDPYAGLKKKDKEFLESVNSKIRSGTYRDPGTLTRNLKSMNKKISAYQAKVSSYERSNTRKKIDTLSQARLRMQEAGIAPAPVPNVPAVAPNVPAVAPNVPVALKESPAVADSIDVTAPMVAARLSPILEVSTAEENSNSTGNKGGIQPGDLKDNPVNDKSKFDTIDIPGDGWCFYSAILRGLDELYDPTSSHKFAIEISTWLNNNRSIKPPAAENINHPTFEEKYNETVGKELIPVYGGEGNRKLTYDEYRELTTQTTQSQSPKVWAEVGISGYAAADIKNIHIKVYNNLKTHVADYYPLIGKGTKTIRIFNENGNHFNLLVPKAKDKIILKKSKSTGVTGGKVGEAPVPVALEDNHKDSLIESTEISELDILNIKLAECNMACLQLKKQINAITSSDRLPYELDDSDKLIDLLEKVILHPEWKERISNLIHISTSVTGQNRLRGGSYFEAIFQLAIAIGALPQFKSKFVRFYDISDYKTLTPLPNYLHTKSVKNEGVSETGISDITFEVSDTPFDYETDYDVSVAIPSKKYECGSVPTSIVPLENGDTKKRNPLYFISVKRFLKNEKSIAKSYDIPILNQQLQELAHGSKYIMVGVKNKDKFLSNLSRTRIDFIKTSIQERVIGYEEVIEAFSDFRLSFFNKPDVGIDATPEVISAKLKELYPMNHMQKPILSLYFHQELVVESVMNRIKSIEVSDRPHFMCIGVLPRGGKSFIAGGIIDSHRKLKAKSAGYNILFLTSAINETRTQFKEDLIQMFSEFDDFNFVDVVLSSGGDGLSGTGSKKNNFYFVSRQLSSLKEQFDSEGNPTTIGDPDILQRLERKLGSRPEFDICFFDEAHVGIKSGVVRKNFQKTFEQYKMPIILMTATYKAPAAVLDSALDLFVWDLQDIKDMKGLPEIGLDAFIAKKPDILERYPVTAETILRNRLRVGQTEEQIAKPYVNFPNPNFISLTFTPETIANLLKDGGGYDYSKFSEVNKNDGMLSDNTEYTNWHTLLVNKEHALMLREFMTPVMEKREGGGDGILEGKDRKYRALNQVFNIAQQHGGRPSQSKPFSILMFMPIGKSAIGELCRVWASFMYQSPYWRDNFVFLTLSVYANHKKTPHQTFKTAVEKGICHREDFEKVDLKNIILGIEREALKQGKGLVILSGDVAKMGISLPCVDVVFLMTSNPDADDIIQKMYRALTDNPPYKKDGFIIDLDIKRVIKAMFEYDLEKDKLRIVTKKTPSTEERLMKVFELCNWGQDSYTEDHPEMSFDDIMNEIKRKVIETLKGKILSEFSERFSKLDEKQIDIIRHDAELKALMITTLSNTASAQPKRGGKSKAATIAERGQSVPTSSVAPAATGLPSVPGSLGENGAPSSMPPPPKMLTPEEINKKMMNITKTFINTLVIKSAEPWTSRMNLATLLYKYDENKQESAWPVECNCSSDEDCKAEHANLYDAAVCELKVYANTADGKYDENAHKDIMKLIDRIFENSTLILEWNIYIENLLKDLDEAKPVKSGGARPAKPRWLFTRKNLGNR